MKKIILSFITLTGFFSLSFEFEGNIKVGYDFFRYSTGIIKEINEKIDTVYNKYERGFVLGFELLPLTFKDEKIKLGVGVEYNFGETNVKYFNEPRHLYATMIPLYLTSKFTYYRPKNIDLNLYTLVRLGYAFAKENDEKTSGAYYGLGIGLDYKYFLAEILYDSKYYPTVNKEDISVNTVTGTNKKRYVHDLHHKIGVRLGLQLGSRHFKKPQIISDVKNEYK